MILKTAAPIILLFTTYTYGHEQRQAAKEPELREELLAMQKEDMETRNTAAKELAEKGVPFGSRVTITDPVLAKTVAETIRKMNDVEKKNRTRLKEIVKKYGWPGDSLVEKDGAHAAWWLVQHAEKDLPFQQRCLKLMKAARTGEVDLPDIAYLTDGVLIAQKKKQLYGTQLRIVKGAYKPTPIEDSANVDKRRAEMGMSPLADYLDMAQEELDKTVRKKK